MSRKIFVNLPVRNLDQSKAFFESLGFGFNPQFCDATALCMTISDDIYAMLLTHEKFQQFTPHAVNDANQSSEVLICLSCDSREDVNETIAKATAAGGTTFREPQDYGFMYGHAFKDLDGHIWELMYMDMAAMEQQAAPA